jgi:hypothetical protein
VGVCSSRFCLILVWFVPLFWVYLKKSACCVCRRGLYLGVETAVAACVGRTNDIELPGCSLESVRMVKYVYMLRLYGGSSICGDIVKR